MLEHAIKYARIGYAVFPLRPGGKTPLISRSAGGKGCLDATRDERQITEWWTHTPYANIGLATGRANMAFVIDVDPGHGGETSIKELINKGFLFPRAPLSRTPSGGWHLFLRWREGCKNSTSKMAKGVDTRGDGGYVVAAPSIRFDEQGVVTGEYVWRQPLCPAAELPDAPGWVLERLNPPQTPMLRQNFSANGSTSLSGLVNVVARAQQGNKNSVMFWAACRAGELIREGRISPTEAERALLSAAMGNYRDMPRAIRTCRDGLRKGSGT